MSLPQTVLKLWKLLNLDQKSQKQCLTDIFPQLRPWKQKCIHSSLKKKFPVYLFTSSSHFDPDEKKIIPIPTLFKSLGAWTPPDYKIQNRKTLFLLYIFSSMLFIVSQKWPLIILMACFFDWHILHGRQPL